MYLFLATDFQHDDNNSIGLSVCLVQTLYFE